MKHQSDRKEWEAQVKKLAITRDREISSAKRKEEMDKLKFDSEIAAEINKARLMYDDLLWWKGKYEAAKVSDGTSTATLEDEEEMVAMKELAQLKTQMQQLKDENYHAFNKMLELCPLEDDERDMVLVDKTVYDLILVVFWARPTAVPHQFCQPLLPMSKLNRDIPTQRKMLEEAYARKELGDVEAMETSDLEAVTLPPFAPHDEREIRPGDTIDDESH
ncbi:unnamed protein product [Calypogeia fissa]